MRITVSAKHYAEADRVLDRDAKAYLKECREERQHGHRPHSCYHGTNLWTDYDNICGPCEEGEYDPRWHADDSEERAARQQMQARYIARKERETAILEMLKNAVEADDYGTRANISAISTYVGALQELQRNN